MEQQKISYLPVQVLGYEKNKGYVYGLNTNTGEKVTIKHDSRSQSASFVNNLSDERKKTHTPVGSFVVFYPVTALKAENGFYAAGYCSPVTKSNIQNKSYITPIKVDNKLNTRGGSTTLSASVADADFLSLHKSKDLPGAMVAIQKQSKGKIDGGYARGVLVRVGIQGGPAEKHAEAFEVYPRQNEEFTETVRRYIKSDHFTRLANIAEKALTRANGFVEVMGFTRVAINDYRRVSTLEKFTQMRELKENINGKLVSSWALCALSVSEKGKLDKIIPLNKGTKETNRAACIGRQIGNTGITFQLQELSAPQQARPAENNADYPLRLEDIFNNAGKRTSFKVNGAKGQLKKYEQRITQALPDLPPRVNPDELSYSFPIERKKEVGAVLSDITGAPAIYTAKSQINDGKVFLLTGNTTHARFEKDINSVKSKYQHKDVDNGILFKESDRVNIEQALGEALTKPLLPGPATSKPQRGSSKSKLLKENFIHYGEWLRDRYGNDPQQLMQDLYNDIETVASEAGVDWSEAARIVDIPSPGQNYAKYKGKKAPAVSKNDAGRLSISANSYSITVNNKNTGEDYDCIGFTLTFRNLAHSESVKFHSAAHTFNLYKELGGSKTVGKKFDAEEAAKRQTERDERIAKEAEEELERAAKAREDAILRWNKGSPENGTHAHLVSKGITNIVAAADIRRMPGRNPSYMRQLVNMHGDMVGLQDVYEQKIPGTNSNKMMTEGMKFKDPYTELSTGIHSPVGFNDGQSPMYVAEGFSDSASVNISTGAFVADGINKDNKKGVIAAFRRKNPNRRIIDIADNDASNPNGNVGMMATIESAWENNVEYVVPISESGENLDINEVWQNKGKEGVIALLSNPIAPPKNLLDFHARYLPHVEPRKYEEKLAAAVKEVQQRYPSLTEEKIHIALQTEKLRAELPARQDLIDARKSQKVELAQAPQSNATIQPTASIKPTQQTPAASTGIDHTRAPVTIDLKTHPRTNKKFLLVTDNRGDNNAAITSVLENLTGKASQYSSEFGGYVCSPAYYNLAQTQLHTLTGAPKAYLGMPISASTPGFVIRGNLTSELKTKIKNALGSIDHETSEQERGIWVKEDIALHFITEIMSEELTPDTSINKSVKIESTASFTDERLEQLKDAASTFGMSLKDITKAQTILMANEPTLKQDNYFLAAAFAQTANIKDKALLSTLTPQARYESILKTTLVESPKLLDTSDRAKLIKYAPNLSELGIKYGLIPKEQKTTHEATKRVATEVPEAQEKIDSEHAPNINESTAAEESKTLHVDQDITESGAEEVNTEAEELTEVVLDQPANSEKKVAEVTEPETTAETSEAPEPTTAELEQKGPAKKASVERVERKKISQSEPIGADPTLSEDTEFVQKEELAETGIAATTDISNDLNISEQASLFDFLTNPQPKDHIKASKEAQIAPSIEKESDLNTASVEIDSNSGPEKQAEPKNSGENENKDAVELAAIDGRIKEFVEITVHSIRNGYEHDEYFDSILGTRGAPYYNEQKGNFDSELMAEDLQVIKDNDIPSWPYKEKPTTPSSTFDIIRKDVAKQRVQEFEDYIADLINKRNIKTYNGALKYLQGERDHMSSDLLSNPYRVETYDKRKDEVGVLHDAKLLQEDGEILEVNDLDYFTAKHIFDSQIEALQNPGSEDLFEVPEEQIEEANEEQLPEGIHKIVIGKHDPIAIYAAEATNGQAIYGIDVEVTLRVSNEADTTAALASTGRVAIPENIYSGENNGAKITLNKLSFTKRPIYQVTDGDKKPALYADFIRAQREYNALTPKEETAPSPVLPQVNLSEDQVNSIINSSDYHNLSKEAVATRLIERFGSTLSDSSIRSVYNQLKEASKQSTTPEYTNRFAALVQFAKERAAESMQAGDFYAEAFKKDGVYFEVNPYFDAANQRLDTNALQKDLRAAQHKGVVNFYNQIFAQTHSVNSEEDMLNRVGGFIRNSPAFDSKIGLKVEFENLHDLLNGQTRTAAEFLPPFLQYMRSAESYRAPHKILEVPLKNLASEIESGNFTKDDTLFLADIYQLTNVAQSDTALDIAHKLTVQDVTRLRLTFMSQDELKELDADTIEEYCHTIGIKKLSDPTATAKRIVKRLAEMKETSAIRIAQYNYIVDAIALQEAGKRVPTYTLTDIAKFGGKPDTGMQSLASQWNMRVNAAKNVVAMEDTLKVISSVDLDAINAHKTEEYPDKVLVGIDNATYVTRTKYAYEVAPGKHSETESVSASQGYYVILNDKRLGFTKPVDTSELISKKWTPVSQQAVEWSLNSVESYLNDNRYLAISLLNSDKKLIIKQENAGSNKLKYSVSTIELDGEGISIQRDKPTELYHALSPYFESLESFQVVDPLIDQVSEADNHPYSKISEQLEQISSNADAATNEAVASLIKLEGFGRYQGEDLPTSLRAFAHEMQLDIKDKLEAFVLGKQYVDIDETVISAINEAHEKLNQTETEVQQSIEAASDIEAPTDVFDFLAAFEDSSLSEAERLTEQQEDLTNLKVYDKNTVDSSGVVLAVEQDNAAVAPLWLHKINGLPAQDKQYLVDTKSGDYLFVLPIDEYKKYDVANKMPRSFTLLEGNETDVNRQLASASLQELNELNRFFAVETSNIRAAAASTLKNEIRARRTAAVAIHTDEPISSEDKLHFVTYADIPPHKSHKWLEERQAASQEARVTLNYEKTLTTAQAQGFEPGMSTSVTLIPTRDLVTVLNMDLMSIASNNNLLQLASNTSPLARYIKSNYINNIDKQISDVGEAAASKVYLRLLNDSQHFSVDGDSNQYPTVAMALEAAYEQVKQPEINAGSKIVINRDSGPYISELELPLYPRDSEIVVSDNGEELAFEKSTTQYQALNEGELESVRKKLQNEFSGSIDEYRVRLSNINVDKDLVMALAVKSEKINIDSVQPELESFHPDITIMMKEGLYSVALGDNVSEQASLSAALDAAQSLTRQHAAKPEEIQNDAIPTAPISTSEAILPSDTSESRAETRAREIPREQVERDKQSNRPISGEHEEEGAENRQLRSTSSISSAVSTGSISPSNKRSLSSSRIAQYQFPSDFEESNDWSTKARFDQNLAAIKISKFLEAEGRQATQDEKEVLAKYSGFGGLGAIFDPHQYHYSSERYELKNAITDDEYRSLQSSTLTSYYTPPSLIAKTWDAINHLGFEGGNVLEPSVGTGNFLSACPTGLRNTTNFSGRELEPLTANIAKQLHGNLVKQGGFEKAKYPKGYFDAAVGNIPFGDYSVYDEEYAQNIHQIHDYFFIKSLDKVREGGLVAFITSTGTLDKKNPRARKEMLNRADLVGAIRLPNKMFAKYAGTDVGTDIVFLKKRAVGKMPQNEAWINTEEIEATDRDGNFHDHRVNQYFIENPHMVIGDYASVSTQYGIGLAVNKPDNLDQRITEAIEALPANILNIAPLETTKETHIEAKSEKSSEKMNAVYGKHLRVDSYLIEDGQLKVALQQYDPVQEDYILVSKTADVAKNKVERIKGLVKLKDQIRSHIEIQKRTVGDDGEFYNSQIRLNQAYDQFVKRYGNLNSQTNMSAFKADPDSPLVFGLEKIADNGKDYQKTDVFHSRTINARAEIAKTENVREALKLAMSAHGGIYPRRVESITGKSWEQIRHEAGETMFLNPTTQGWELAEHYLSGNIAKKLEAAQAGAELDDEYQKNVKALEEVMPLPIPLEDIQVRLGADWVPENVVNAFTNYLITGESKTTNDISVVRGLTGWTVNARGAFVSRNNGRARNTYGTKELHAAQLVERLSNGSKIEITYKDDEGKTQIHIEKTAAAKAKAREIGQFFKDWAWQDRERGQVLADAYNRRFNVYVEAKYSGQDINYTGLNPYLDGKRFNPRVTQKDSLMRYFVEQRMVMAHPVGFGKSFSLASIAIEGKERGIHNKPMLVVPNNVYGQLSRAVVKHYPDAKVAYLDPRNLSKDQRQRLSVSIATNDYDLVMVPHSSFNKISAPHNFKKQIMNNQIRELEIAVRESEFAMKGGDTGQSYNIRRLEKRIKSLEAKLEKLDNVKSKDDLLFIDDLGVDTLLVDEADNYINIPYATNMGHVAGVNTSESQRALNMLYNSRYIQSIRDDKGIVMATGTDIRKSMSDMYAMLYLVAPDKLSEMDVEQYDRFMSVFGEVVTSIEVSPEGSGYRENSRLSKFINLPELAMLYRSVADVPDPNAADISRPNKEIIAIECDAGPVFEAYMRHIAERAIAFRNGNPNDDEWFRIQHDATRASLDMRLINQGVEPAATSKYEKATDNIARIYHEKSDEITTQIVFLDSFVHEQKSSGFRPYDELIKGLVEKGIPEDKIIDSRNVDTEAKKKAFEEGMNTGKYAVAIGTTERFGVGNNIQKYLYAMHELDPPWNPRDLEQRMGRIWRSGNTNENIKMFRYVTQDSFDIFKWDTIKRKAGFITQAKLTPADAPRVYEEDTDVNINQIMSIATKNPLMKEKITLDAKLQEMEVNYKSFHRNQMNNQQGIEMLERKIDRTKENLVKWDSTIERMEGTPKSNINSTEVSYKDEITDALKACLVSEIDRVKSGEEPRKEVPVGYYKGQDIWFEFSNTNEGPRYVLMIDVADVHMRLTKDTRPGAMYNMLEKVIDECKTQKNSCVDQVSNMEASLASMKSSIVEDYPKMDELVSMRSRAAELEAEVVKLANEQLGEELNGQEKWEEIESKINVKSEFQKALDNTEAITQRI